MTAPEGAPHTLMADAIGALGRGDAASARSATSAAVALDPSLAALADLIGMATAELEKEGEVGDAAWNAVADACPDELRDAVETWRR